MARWLERSALLARVRAKLFSKKGSETLFSRYIALLSCGTLSVIYKEQDGFRPLTLGGGNDCALLKCA